MVPIKTLPLKNESRGWLVRKTKRDNPTTS